MKTTFITLIMSMILFVGCDKVDRLTHFTLNDQFETTIKAGFATMLPADIETPPVTSNVEKEMGSRNSRVDMIESVTMKSMQMILYAPDGKNFDFLKDIELFISAEGLPEKRIAYFTEIPDTIQNTLILKCENQELESFIKKGSYHIRMRVTTDKILHEDIGVRVVSSYFVDAKILGI